MEAQEYGRSGLERGRETVRDIKSDIKSNIQDVTDSVSKVASEAAHDLKEKGGELFQQVKEGSNTQLKYIEDQIRANPIRAVAVSAFAGFVLCRMFRE